jgi:hypothetical protein
MYVPYALTLRNSALSHIVHLCLSFDGHKITNQLSKPNDTSNEGRLFCGHENKISRYLHKK